MRATGELTVTSAASLIARDANGKGAIAIALAGSGRVLVTGDINLLNDSYISIADNLVFAGNVFNWLRVGSGSAPVISVTTASLSDFGNVQAGSALASQAYSVSGSNLTSNIVVTTPAGFQVSTNNSTFGGSATLTQSSGVVPATPLYVRFHPSTRRTVRQRHTRQRGCSHQKCFCKRDQNGQGTTSGDTTYIPGGTLANGENAGLMESTINGDTTKAGTRNNPNRVYALYEGQVYYQLAPLHVIDPSGSPDNCRCPQSEQAVGKGKADHPITANWSDGHSFQYCLWQY